MRIWPEKTQDQEFNELGSRGFKGSLNDRQYAYLLAAGYKGALADMSTSYRAYSPKLLFASSEVGVWYDPSDLTTMFQDSAGTIPVTAVGQPVGLRLDKSKGLVLGPELVTNGTFNSNIDGWTANLAATVVWDAGRMVVTRGSSAADVGYQAFSTVSGRTYKLSYRATGSSSSCRVATSTAFLSNFANLPAGESYFVAQSATTYIGFGSAGNGLTAYFDNISVRELPGNHASQSTPGSRAILRQVNGLYCLQYDGLDDFYVTSAINFSATDKMTVFAGVRKLSDAAQGVVAELTNFATNRFTISAPTGATANFGFASGGSTMVFPSSAPSFASPYSAVLTGIGDISGDVATLRINGTQAAQVTTDQGTGNYANAALYIGRRGAITRPFNGYEFGLIVRGAATSATQIASTEAWLNSRTGAY